MQTLFKKNLVKQTLRNPGVFFDSKPTIFNIEEGSPELILSANNAIIF